GACRDPVRAPRLCLAFARVIIEQRIDMTHLDAQPSERHPGEPLPGTRWPREPPPGEPWPGEPWPGGPLPCGLTLAAARFFAARMAGSWVPAYLAGRGFGEQALRPWTVGYAPAGWRVLTAYLRDLGYD